MTHNGGEERVSVRVRVRDREGGKYGGRKYCIEGKDGWEWWGEGKEKKTELHGDRLLKGTNLGKQKVEISLYRGIKYLL